jgi:hypothetical protein
MVTVSLVAVRQAVGVNRPVDRDMSSAPGSGNSFCNLHPRGAIFRKFRKVKLPKIRRIRQHGQKPTSRR